MLHTVNKSPFEKDSLNACLRLAKAGSAILLIEDGVYAAIKGTAVEDKVKAAVGDKKVFALRPDIKARGFDEGQVIDGITVIGYGEFVDLATENDKVQAWL